MKLKKLLTITLSVCMVLASVSYVSFAQSGIVRDDDAKTIAIYDAQGFKDFAAIVNGGDTLSGYTVTLEESIDLGNEEWTPMSKFSGNFDGKDNSISGLKITNTTEDYCGLFKTLSGATVENLRIKDANINSSGWTGVLAGYAEGSEITYLNISGSITAHGTGEYESGNHGIGVGGIVEYAGYGTTITGCTSSVNIDAFSTKEIMYAGGIAAEVNASTITGCTNSGTITAISPSSGGYAYVGGIATYVKNGSTITDCNNTGTITAGSDNSYYATAGGILGEIWVEAAGTITVTGCTNSGTVTASSMTDGQNYCGTIVGEIYTHDGTQNINTLIVDEAVINGTGWDQRNYISVDRSVVFLNGLTGDDANDGKSIDTPVKTVAKALELVDEKGKIRVSGEFKANEVITKPVTIEGADEGGTKVAYTTVLPKVNGTVIFRNLLYPSAGINGGGSHDSLEYENLNLIFDNCSFTNAGGGCINIYPQIASLTVTNCSFSTTSETYLKQYLIWPYQAKEIDILFNTFDGGGVTRSPIHLGQGHPEGTTAIIENNTISNYERGIQVALETELTGTAKHEITITNNDFSGIKLSSITTAAPEEYGIVFLHEVHNPANTESIIITDNTVSDCGTHLVYSENEAAMEDYNITFTENTEGGSDVGGLEDNFYTPYGTEITFKESESIKYSDDTLGGIRFIFDTSITDTDEITAFGAYILPFSIFKESPENITLKSVNVQYIGNINSGDTFSADIVDIPKSAFDTDVYAVPYFVTDGNVNTFTGKDANVNNN